MNGPALGGGRVKEIYPDAQHLGTFLRIFYTETID